MFPFPSVYVLITKQHSIICWHTSVHFETLFNLFVIDPDKEIRPNLRITQE
jgi:hypothetical protein